VVGSCEYSDEPSGSGAMELVSLCCFICIDQNLIEFLIKPVSFIVFGPVKVCCCLPEA
jgi:hypothetical protein